MRGRGPLAATTAVFTALAFAGVAQAATSFTINGNPDTGTQFETGGPSASITLAWHVDGADHYWCDDVTHGNNHITCQTTFGGGGAQLMRVHAYDATNNPLSWQENGQTVDHHDYSWNLDKTGGGLTNIDAPSGIDDFGDSPTISWEATEPNETFQCVVENSPFGTVTPTSGTPCGTPDSGNAMHFSRTFSGLYGPHRVWIFGVDHYGNVGLPLDGASPIDFSNLGPVSVSFGNGGTAPSEGQASNRTSFTLPVSISGIFVTYLCQVDDHVLGTGDGTDCFGLPDVGGSAQSGDLGVALYYTDGHMAFADGPHTLRITAFDQLSSFGSAPGRHLAQA